MSIRPILFFLVTSLFWGASPLSAQDAADPVTYDNGLVLQSHDQNIVFKITGKIQPKYQFNRDPQNSPAKRQTFALRRAGLDFRVITHKKVKLGFGLNHSTNSQNFSSVNVLGAAFDYVHSPALNISIGMVGLPLDEWTFASSSRMLFTEAPLTATQTDQIKAITIARSSFGGPDGLGFSLSGDINSFFYMTNVVNGAQDNYQFNPNLRPSFGAMVGYNIAGDARGADSDFNHSPSPQMTVTVGALYETKKSDPLGDPSLKLIPAVIDYAAQASTGFTLLWKGFALRTEGYLKQIRVSRAGSAIDLAGYKTDLAYYATAGYFLVPKRWEAALMGAQIFREGQANNSHQLGGGFNWYLYQQNIKIQTDYYFKKEYDRVTGRNYQDIHTLDVMLTAYF